MSTRDDWTRSRGRLLSHSASSTILEAHSPVRRAERNHAHVQRLRQELSRSQGAWAEHASQGSPTSPARQGEPSSPVPTIGLDEQGSCSASSHASQRSSAGSKRWLAARSKLRVIQALNDNARGRGHAVGEDGTACLPYLRDADGRLIADQKLPETQREQLKKQHRRRTLTSLRCTSGQSDLDAVAAVLKRATPRTASVASGSPISMGGTPTPSMLRPATTSTRNRQRMNFPPERVAAIEKPARRSLPDTTRSSPATHQTNQPRPVLDDPTAGQSIAHLLFGALSPIASDGGCGSGYGSSSSITRMSDATAVQTAPSQHSARSECAPSDSAPPKRADGPPPPPPKTGARPKSSRRKQRASGRHASTASLDVPAELELPSAIAAQLAARRERRATLAASPITSSDDVQSIIALQASAPKPQVSPPAALRPILASLSSMSEEEAGLSSPE